MQLCLRAERLGDAYVWLFINSFLNVNLHSIYKGIISPYFSPKILLYILICGPEVPLCVLLFVIHIHIIYPVGSKVSMWSYLAKEASKMAVSELNSYFGVLQSSSRPDIVEFSQILLNKQHRNT